MKGKVKIKVKSYSHQAGGGMRPFCDIFQTFIFSLLKDFEEQEGKENDRVRPRAAGFRVYQK